MKGKESLHFAFMAFPEHGKHSAENGIFNSLASVWGEETSWALYQIKEPSPTSCLRSYFKGRRRPRSCLSGSGQQMTGNEDTSALALPLTRHVTGLPSWTATCLPFLIEEGCTWTSWKALRLMAVLWTCLRGRGDGGSGKGAEFWGWGVDTPTPWKPKLRSILELMLCIHNFLWMMNAMAKTCFIPVFEKGCNC